MLTQGLEAKRSSSSEEDEFVKSIAQSFVKGLSTSSSFIRCATLGSLKSHPFWQTSNISEESTDDSSEIVGTLLKGRLKYTVLGALFANGIPSNETLE
jgi:hypothetical protein